jgi:hypothetical protein
MTRVILDDLRAERICLAGARTWWRRHGLDWRRFVADGIDAEILTATGDGMALRVVARAERREALRHG